MKYKRSAVWGGATIGFFIGLIVGVLSGNFLTKLIFGVVIGAGFGVIANALGWISDKLAKQ